MGLPTKVIRHGRGLLVASSRFRRRDSVDRIAGAILVVVSLEVDESTFQVAGVPEKRAIKKFTANSSDQALDERARSWNTGNAFDLIDIQNAKVRFPLVVSEERIIIGAEISGLVRT